MSQAAAQASAFYREVALHRSVWTIADAGGYPAPMTSSGQRAQPFWSLRSRAEKVIAKVPAYAAFMPEEISWPDFRDNWLSELAEDRLLVGVNWSGPFAKGYDLPPAVVKARIEAAIAGHCPAIGASQE